MTIEERLAQLERKNRRLTLALLSLGGTVGVAVVLIVAARMAPAGTAPQEVIIARKFLLVDDKGHECAVWGVKDGKPGILLGKPEDKAAAVLTITDEGPTLALVGENGWGSAGLEVIKKGPRLSLYDKNNKKRAFLGIGKGDPFLIIYDENEAVRIGLGIVENVGATLTFYDENQKIIRGKP